MNRQCISFFVFIFSLHVQASVTEIYEDATNQSGRYTVMNGVVFDRLSNLLWEQTVSSTPMNFTDAETYCSGKNIANLTGWYVPDLEELQSLVDYVIQFPNAPINAEAFPGDGINDKNFISSTIQASDSRNNSWNVLFWNNGESWVSPMGNLNWVRCVWSSHALSSTARYTSAAGIVTDAMTGLLWLQHAPSSTQSHAEASSYCNRLSLGGLRWRLPSIKELETLVDYRVPFGNLMMNMTVFENESSGIYWSSTPEANGQDNAWIVNFNNGAVYYKNTANLYNVRCVSAINARPGLESMVVDDGSSRIIRLSLGTFLGGLLVGGFFGTLLKPYLGHRAAQPEPV